MTSSVEASMEDMVRVRVTVTVRLRVRLLPWRLPLKLSRNLPWKMFVWKLLPRKLARKLP